MRFLKQPLNQLVVQSSTRLAWPMMLALVVALCLSTATVAAHEPMQHDCVAPMRPHDDQDEVLWGRFKQQIDGFRNCVHRNMQWHQENAKQHNRAAMQAVEAWNSFVHGSLNAPEDFPWPSADADGPPS